MSAKAPNLAAGRSATVALAGRLVPGIIDADGRPWAFSAGSEQDPPVYGGPWRPATLPTITTQLALPGLAEPPRTP